MEVQRLWFLNKGPFQKAFFSTYENEKRIMNGKKIMFLLICSFSWCLLKSKEERNCNIKIARNYYHSRGNNWQLFLVDIPRTIFLWLLYSHVVTSQNRHGFFISYLSRENCVNWTTLLHSNLFDFIEMQTLTFQIRFFCLTTMQIFLWDWYFSLLFNVWHFLKLLQSALLMDKPLPFEITLFEKSNFCPKIQFCQNHNIFTSFSHNF